MSRKYTERENDCQQVMPMPQDRAKLIFAASYDKLILGNFNLKAILARPMATDYRWHYLLDG